MLNAIDKRLLQEAADLHDIPQGAYNIRKNGEGISRNTTANIDIVTKQDKPGIDIIIKPKTKGESVHIPVILSKEGLNDTVYNTFEVGEDSDVVIVAGCGIHNSGSEKSQHDGVHEFFVRKGAHIKYVEKHYGEGDGTGERVLNPKTIIEAHYASSFGGATLMWLVDHIMAYLMEGGEFFEISSVASLLGVNVVLLGLLLWIIVLLVKDPKGVFTSFLKRIN